MRPAHALLALVTLAGLVVAGLFVFAPERDGRSPSPTASASAGEARAPAEPPHEPFEAPLAPEGPAEPAAGLDMVPELSARAPEASSASGTIRGRVVGAPPELLATLEVQATALDTREPARLARCDAEGCFVLDGLRPSATFNLRAFPAGRASFGHSRTNVRTARPGAGEVELAWLPERALLFQVVASSGPPLVEFEVRLGRAYKRPLLDDSGRIRTRFPEGRVCWVDWAPEELDEPFELVVSARGYHERRIKDVLAPVGADLNLGRIILDRGPRLIVGVMDESTEQPLQGALVSLLLPGETRSPGGSQGFDPFSARTDEKGRVLLTSLPGERALLRVRAAGYEELERSLLLGLVEEQREIVAVAPVR